MVKELGIGTIFLSSMSARQKAELGEKGYNIVMFRFFFSVLLIIFFFFFLTLQYCIGVYVYMLGAAERGDTEDQPCSFLWASWATEQTQFPFHVVLNIKKEAHRKDTFGALSSFH